VLESGNVGVKDVERLGDHLRECKEDKVRVVVEEDKEIRGLEQRSEWVKEEIRKNGNEKDRVGTWKERGKKKEEEM
jgi:hypothetical protein